MGQARYSLRLLREAVGLTQGSVSEASGLYQPDLSKLENKATLDDVQISTLRRYAKALGGDVELAVVLNGRRYTLKGPSPASGPVRCPRGTSAPASEGAIALEQKCEARRIGGLTRYDPRTVLKAIREGLDAIKTQRIREDLRPHVEALRGRWSSSSAA